MLAIQSADETGIETEAWNEENFKLSADNIISINILNRPSPIKEYRYNMLERSSRPSRNRVRDSKGTSITFYSNFLHARLMMSIPI